jgi:hypothetical protein
MKTLANHEAQHLTIAEYKNAFKNVQNPTAINTNNKVYTFFKETVFFMKYMYFVVLLIMILGVLFEIKCIYNIDVFRNVNTPLDTYYYEAKANLTNDLR